LLLTTPEGQQVVELAAHNSLGRHPTNSVQLLDKIVSKEHCIIELRGTQFVLRDLGSLNGTYVNGERVAGERMLNNGDEIALGSTRARFEHAASAAPQGRAPYPQATRPSPLCSPCSRVRWAALRRASHQRPQAASSRDVPPAPCPSTRPARQRAP